MSQFFYAPNCMVKIPVVYNKTEKKDGDHSSGDLVEKFGLSPEILGIKGGDDEEISETVMDFTCVSAYSNGINPNRTTVWQSGWRWEIDMPYKTFDALFNAEMRDKTATFKEICRGNK